MTSYRVVCRYRRGCLLWWSSRNRAVLIKFDGLLHTNDHCRINMPILRYMEVDDMNLPCTSDYGFVVLIPEVLLTKWGRWRASIINRQTKESSIPVPSCFRTALNNAFKVCKICSTFELMPKPRSVSSLAFTSVRGSTPGKNKWMRKMWDEINTFFFQDW